MISKIAVSSSSDCGGRMGAVGQHAERRAQDVADVCAVPRRRGRVCGGSAGSGSSSGRCRCRCVREGLV